MHSTVYICTYTRGEIFFLASSIKYVIPVVKIIFQERFTRQLKRTFPLCNSEMKGLAGWRGETDGLRD